MTNQVTNAKTTESVWKSLYKVGGVAALIIVVLIPIQSFIFVAYPLPSTVIGYFTLFQNNWFLGLLDLDLLYIVDSALLILIYLALYAALKRASESFTAIALTIGLVGIAAYFASNTAFEMLSLSNQYAVAATDAQRSVFLAAGQAMLAIYQGTAFNVYYILNAIALLIMSTVMLRSNLFSKVTAYGGILAGVLMLVPSTAGTIGIAFAFASLVPWAIFSVLIARRLFQLGAGVLKEQVQ
jgi:hypothetical protein